MKNLAIILMTLFASCGRNFLTQQEIQDLNNRQTKCEDAITLWIKNHALYPDSYQSLGFKEYSEGVTLNGNKKIPNTESYSIFHTHKIKNTKGDTVIFSGYFKLEYDYFVDIIETTNSTSIGGAYPPKTKIWLEQFGRSMTAKDSTELNERQRAYSKKTLDELRNLKYESEEDKEKVKELLDTTNKK